jgi:hypothetical protein
MINIDRYPKLGELQHATDWNDLLSIVRGIYPLAYAEGSTGTERTWFAEGGMVAHSWSPGGRLIVYCVRVKPRVHAQTEIEQ